MKKVFASACILMIFILMALGSVAQGARLLRFYPASSNGLSVYDLRKVWHPARFQGNLRNHRYYEGWYFKVVSEDLSHRFAFIPGISLGEDPHAFIQVIDGSTGESQYYRFPVEDFSYSRKTFAVRIAGNFFSDREMFIDVGKGQHHYKGEIRFSGNRRFPVTLSRPGIMGWYRYVPFMETYHGVVSLNHQLHGQLVNNSDTLFFDNGSGYIEKDWGSSMPRAWIWMQSNSFSQQDDISFMLSVAHIPWLGSSFTGFLGFLMFNGQLLPFATYTSARLQKVDVLEDEVNIEITGKGFKLFISGNKGIRGVLLAPVTGVMSRPIHESLDAEISLRLEDASGKVLFQGTTLQAGLELVGDYNKLQP